MLDPLTKGKIQYWIQCVMEPVANVCMVMGALAAFAVVIGTFGGLIYAAVGSDTDELPRELKKGRFEVVEQFSILDDVTLGDGGSMHYPSDGGMIIKDRVDGICYLFFKHGKSQAMTEKPCSD